MGNNFSTADSAKYALYLGVASTLTVGGLLVWDRVEKEQRRKRKAAKKGDNADMKSETAANASQRSKQTGHLLRQPTKHGLDGFNPIYKICITGGPCGGKTSALAYLTEKLSEKGFKVFCAPEVPTMTMLGGGMIVMANLTQDKIIRFQTLLMRTQMNIEEYFYDLAELNGAPSVVLFDRGVMDPSAYMTPEQFQALLDENGWNKVTLRDQRYDMVIHMVTAADGAEESYTTANNAARYEKDLSVAIDTDRKTQNAWIGHPHLVIIDNTTEKGFDRKLNRVFESIGKTVGFPTPNKYFRKYLIDAGTSP